MDPALPAHPQLLEIAEALERSGTAWEIWDHRWRSVFMSSEGARLVGLKPDERVRFYGMSPVVRAGRFPEIWGPDEESALLWWEAIGPSMVHDVPPDAADFESTFGAVAEEAKKLTPASPPPAVVLPGAVGFARTPGVEQTWRRQWLYYCFRLYDGGGTFLGTAVTLAPPMSTGLLARLARGDAEMLERMDRLREPARRPSAILFADVAASGELSRRLSSSSYFELIRSLTDLIDAEVAAVDGVLGKHAGDGASALFLAGDGARGESAAARSAIEAARAIRDGGASLTQNGEPEVRVKAGVHWGGTLMVGQVSSHGRLEVTALGDEMNEAARIEGVACGGVVLASKGVIERLNDRDAEALGLPLESLAYKTVAELKARDKDLRDAGSIAVAAV